MLYYLLGAFPNINEFSAPLLLFTVQGCIFAALLLKRFFKEKQVTDLLLSILLLVTAYRCISYTIGFMAWYDTYPNTKLNYFLFETSWSLGPLVYFYIRAITQPYFKFRKEHYLHFAPQMLTIAFELSIYLYDLQQPNFYDSQNGVAYTAISMGPFGMALSTIATVSQVVYYAFAAQAFWFYRKRIVQFFSDTHKLELRWVRNFLISYIFLFLFLVLMNQTGMAGADWHWEQRFWWYLAATGVTVYLGWQGYAAKLAVLNKLEAPTLSFEEAAPLTTSPQIEEGKDNKGMVEEVRPELLQLQQNLLEYMGSEKPYLDPDLTLSDLADQLNTHANSLSQVINSNLGQNFNEFINKHRVEAVQQALEEGKQEQLSLLGIAHDCGFNSKATFNRVFKKQTGLSPSAYAKQKMSLAA